ncbi:MAG: hypothetical protein K2X03_14610 [Bryobacteraceae bacterium]|nr:hypothetical protein [Bryobacteraceae bacterium]
MFLRCFFLVSVLATLATAQSTIGIGQGAPSDAIRQRFFTNYYRGRFPSLTSLPPLTSVSVFGGTGYLQEFPDLTKNAGLRHAIIVGKTIVDPDGFFIDTYQVYSSMYAYYISGGLGFANLGFPISDTDIVEVRDSATGTTINTFQYQFFERNYALFVWSSTPDSTSTNTNFALREPFLTRWKALGQLSGLGGMTSVEATITRDIVTATQVNFQNGYLFNTTAGPSAGRIVAVREPINSVYRANGGPAGRLGLPLNDELVLANGRRRQTFQGASIEYGGNETPVLRNAVFAVSLTSVGSVRLNLNDTLPIGTQIVTNAGESVTDRDVSWTTSNSRVIQIAVGANQTGTATLRAVGGGSAFVTATSEGKTSAPLTVFVSAPCCAVGEGAPTAALQQSFQDAIARNRLTPRLPSASPVQRFGAGYLQEFVTADAATRFVLAKPDSSSLAYLLTGGLLNAYEANGGPAGALGYPSSDPSATGRQLFENQAALAGDPVRAVSGVILTRWAQLGYETGALGNPSGEVSRFLTFNATAGRAQSFRNGAILVAETGPQANRAFFVVGPVAAKYAELGGALGAAGLPLSDEFQVGASRRQEFEGATYDYTPGENLVRVTDKARRPTVLPTPATVVAGNRVRLSVGGFAEGAQLRISVTGQADFTVSTTTGAYAWDVFVPTTARTGAVTVRAVAVGGTSPPSAEAVYQVRALADIRFTLTKVRGDTQTGPPGAVLPVALRIALRDEFGSPVVNSPVRFNPSPGGVIARPEVITNGQGEAETTMRLPPGEGVALATAEAGRQAVTFSFRVAAQSLNNFPRLTQNSEEKLGNGAETLNRKGALLAAMASVLRYHQGRGELAQPNGPAEPLVLNQFLRDACVFDGSSNRICDSFLPAFDAPGEQILNPWRVGLFTGGGVDVSVEAPASSTIRDLVAAGSPVIAALSLTLNGQPAGSHFVVAMGIDGAGSEILHDPSPALNRTSLAEYLNGFTNSAGAWRGVLTGAFRLLPRAPAPGQFLVHTNAQVGLASVAGDCGRTLEFPQVAAVPAGVPLASAPPALRFRACVATPPVNDPFQLDLASAAAYRAVLTDLGQPAQRVELSAATPAAYRVSRPNGAQLLVAAQTLTVRADQVVNAASFSRILAPGALVSIFGAGLSAAGSPTALEVDGAPAAIGFVSPFQINAQIPPTASPGQATLRVRSPFGVTEQPITISPVAPAIFQLGGGIGAVVNQDGQINGPTAPVSRGQVIVVYGTGFGATRAQGQLQIAASPMTAFLNDQAVTVNYAGLTPGFVGLYQANLLIPNNLPPLLDYRLVLRQAGVESNAVTVSVQ